MTPRCDGQTAVYEVTIAGSIGPVLRSALLPHRVASSRARTILRVAPVPRMDLPDLVLELHRRGFDIEDVLKADAAVDPGPRPRPSAARAVTTGERRSPLAGEVQSRTRR